MELALDLEARLLEEVLHGAIIRQHFGGESVDAVFAGDVDEMVQQSGSQADPCQPSRITKAASA